MTMLAAKASPSVHGWSLLLFLLVAIVAVLFGLMSGVGAYQFIIIFIVLLAGPVLVIYPKIGLWSAVVFSLVGAGLIDLYLPSMQPLKWGVLLLSLALLVYAFLQSWLEMRTQTMHPVLVPLMVALGLFCLSVIVSSIVNWHGVKALAVGMKGYFQAWGLLAAIYYLCKNEIDAGRFLRFLLLLALIQLPFIVHQYFWLVPKRTSLAAAEHGVVAVDVVAGTFGGSMMGGGRSSSLALLLVLVLTMVLAMWRAHLMSTKRVVLMSVLCLLPLFVNEAKVVIVLLPVALFILFADRIKTHPLQFLFGALSIALLLAALVGAYLMLPSTDGQQHQQSFDRIYEDTLKYNIGNVGYGGLKLNRLSVYPFWYAQNQRDGLVHVLVGHGPGQTNDGSAILSESISSTRYKGFGIGLTAISAMLWELGLLGVAAICSMFFLAYRTAKKLADDWRGTVHWPLIKTAQIAMPLFAVNLIHNNFFVIDLSFQALFVLFLGYIMVMTRFTREPHHA